MFLFFIFPDHGHKSDSPFKNYIVLVLALICILTIGGLIIVALKRPRFCKKGQEHGDGENPVNMMSSSSPHPPQNSLDSLPIAMNTGIFLPGASYDMQDVTFQNHPIVGTTVFK